MKSPVKVGVIVGSNRRESINRKLANAIIQLDAPSLAFEHIRIDDLPMYNGDLEGARPAEVNRFTSEVAACDALLFVMPEHNRSLPAVLKNAIDWGSKPTDKNVWRDKTAAITGTSPGVIGTAVGQQHLRQILGILGATVLGGEAYISFKPDLLDAQGAIATPATREFLQAYLNRFAALAGKLAA
ncbi:NAD(P)H-dependent oxidoreductase [Variovorax sp. J22R133]|uniref:NADPH-dependent FMN reductase n=1 Tax=Variovorax brevis TaxID=3053503 RepID=UPI002575804A|nr:NAD(P)H-dependent oxidoreductase [Variovorax sp. J22R133]MDM0112645.1 NAD(P)H-dependent oxidoreductase [Variovorax sp. J22R133]